MELILVKSLSQNHWLNLWFGSGMRSDVGKLNFYRQSSGYGSISLFSSDPSQDQVDFCFLGLLVKSSPVNYFGPNSALVAID